MPWYFIPGVLKLANRKMYVRNGYDGDSETVNMLARHTALKCWISREIRWYRNVVSRGSAVQNVALLPVSAMRLWASSDKGQRVSTATGKKREWRRSYCTWSTFSPTRPLQRHVGCCQCVSKCHIPCGTASRLPWYIKTLGLFPSSLLRPWGPVTAVISGRGESSRWAKLGAELCVNVSCRTTHVGREYPPWCRRGTSEPRRLQNPGGDQRPRVWRCDRGGDHKRWSEEYGASRRYEVLPLPTVWPYDMARYNDWASYHCLLWAVDKAHNWPHTHSL